MKRFIAVIVGALALIAVTAGPALAQGSPQNFPVQVSSTVSSALTVSGISPTITFPSSPAGTTATAPNAEVYTIATNDPGGYQLSVTAPVSGLVNAGGTATIPDSALSISEHGTRLNGQTFTFGGSGAMTLDAPIQPGSYSYSEDWKEAIPGNQVADTYTGTFTYTITPS